jgi:hypothetical protein
MFFCFVTEQLETYLVPQATRVLVLETQHETSNQTKTHQALPNKPKYSVTALLENSIVVMRLLALRSCPGVCCAAISSWR